MTLFKGVSTQLYSPSHTMLYEREREHTDVVNAASYKIG
jgi:hypothetical protein